MRLSFALALAPTLGCSFFGQVSGGASYGAVNGESFAGGGVTGHVGLGGSEATQQKDEWTHASSLGVDVMLRVEGTTRFTSFAIAEGIYYTMDIGKHTGIARLAPMLMCNTEDVLLCGAGVRAELAFGIGLDQKKVYVPGFLIDEHRRTRKLFTIGIFAEYAGYFTRKTEIPMIGIEIGYGAQDEALKTTRGQLLR